MSSIYECLTSHKFSEIDPYECVDYLPKLHLLYKYYLSKNDVVTCNEINKILINYFNESNEILPFVSMDFNVILNEVNSFNFKIARNKSSTQLLKEFEHGTPLKKFLLITQEFYHLSNGSKVLLYYETNSLSLLCRHNRYQNIVKIIVILMLHINKFILSPNTIMECVLNHCKSRQDFILTIFKNISSNLNLQLIKTIVLFTTKHQNLIQKTKQSFHSHSGRIRDERKFEAWNKQVEIMKTIFKKLGLLSKKKISNLIQIELLNKKIFSDIYVEKYYYLFDGLMLIIILFLYFDCVVYSSLFHYFTPSDVMLFCWYFFIQILLWWYEISSTICWLFNSVNIFTSPIIFICYCVSITWIAVIVHIQYMLVGGSCFTSYNLPQNIGNSSHLVDMINSMGGSLWFIGISLTCITNEMQQQFITKYIKLKYQIIFIISLCVLTSFMWFNDFILIMITAVDQYIHILTIILLLLYFVIMLRSCGSLHGFGLFLISICGVLAGMIFYAYGVRRIYSGFFLIITPFTTIMAAYFISGILNTNKYLRHVVTIYSGTLDIFTDILIVIYWMQTKDYIWTSIQILILLFSQIMSTYHVIKKHENEWTKNDIGYVIFSSFGFGQQYYTIVTWTSDDEQESEKLLSTIKTHELFLESLPSFTFQWYILMSPSIYNSAVTASLIFLLLNSSFNMWLFIVRKSDTNSSKKGIKKVIDILENQKKLYMLLYLQLFFDFYSRAFPIVGNLSIIRTARILNDIEDESLYVGFCLGFISLWILFLVIYSLKMSVKMRPEVNGIHVIFVITVISTFYNLLCLLPISMSFDEFVGHKPVDKMIYKKEFITRHFLSLFLWILLIINGEFTNWRDKLEEKSYVLLIIFASCYIVIWILSWILNEFILKYAETLKPKEPMELSYGNKMQHVNELHVIGNGKIIQHTSSDGTVDAQFEDKLQGLDIDEKVDNGDRTPTDVDGDEEVP